MVTAILFILMPVDFKDIEFKKPYDELHKAGYIVDVAGLKPGVAHGVDGLEHAPNLQLANLNEKDFDKYAAVVIPGGPGSTTYTWNNKQIMKTINYFASKNKIVAAICHGCPVLAQAGILKGKSATTYPSNEAKEVFKQCNVTFVDKGCVVSQTDHVITAQGPKYAAEFSQAILNMLKQIKQLTPTQTKPEEK